MSMISKKNVIFTLDLDSNKSKIFSIAILLYIVANSKGNDGTDVDC